jgi:KDO2-lipid IV(A) lauroyltransferase
MKLAADYLVYLALRVVFCILQALPTKECLRLAEPLSHLVTDVFKIRADVIDDNLRHAFPELSAAERKVLSRRHWQHLLLMIFEIASAERKIHLTNWRNHIRFRNKRVLVRELLKRQPRVLVSGHYGNFEVGGMIIGLFGFPVFTIARPLDNRFLDNFFKRLRAAHGLQMLKKQGSAKEAAALLASGTPLMVLGDQAAGERGCWVDFFGRPASTHKAIALFGLSFSAPMVVVYCRRLDHPLLFEVGCEAVADPAVDLEEYCGVRELTEWYTQQLETIVRRDPHQYWWAHRRWKGKPRKRQRGLKAA